jgi:CO/xanthine dehydrogenase Mo-binding subunit
MTYMTGNALIEAASMLKKQLLELAARMMDLSPQQLTYEQGMVILPNGDKVGAVEFVSRAAEEGRPIKAEGTYSFPNPKTIIPQFLPLGVHQILFTVACQVARVEVDPELGTVEITDLVAIHDVGRMISKSAVEGQIDGGVLTGIGYALYEEMTLKEDGQWVDSFSEYLLPTSQDLPRNYERIILEIPEESGPYGAKGVGEITLVPTAPAIAAAVHEAVGVRINKLPIKPSDLVQA